MAVGHYENFPVASLLLLGSGEALATTVSFADTTKYWPGYANGTADDAKDTIGTPDFTGGSAVFDDATGRLTGLSFSYTGKFSPVASGDARVIPGDILLDLGSDGHWDFVIKLVAGPQTPVADYSSLSILDVHDIASPSYLLSGSDNTGYWHGYGIRDQHPYAWAGGGTVVGTASLGAFDQLASGGTLHLDLRSGLPTNPSLTIGFAPSCANDVVLVVGHSSSMPLVIKALGGPAITVAEDEYDAIYFLVPASGTLSKIRY